MGDSAEACRQTADEGACWVFVRSRWDHIMYGFYPSEERWRVHVVGFISVLFVGLGTLTPLKKSFPFWFVTLVAVPTLFWGLLRGTFFGLAEVPTDKWGGLFLTFVVSASGILTSLPLGTLLALGRRSSLPIMRWVSVAFIELWRGGAAYHSFIYVLCHASHVFASGFLF